MINLSKVAVGCSSVEALRARQQQRIRDGVVRVFTRFRPRRADELVGGSLFWIVRHRIMVRQSILGFDDGEIERKTVIRLDPLLTPVEPRPRRAHQGWRYLAPEDTPADLEYGEVGLEALPPKLIGELSELALI
jgi:hypothetical protein